MKTLPKKKKKKEGSRRSVFMVEEEPFLLALTAIPYENVVWKTATVQFNYRRGENKLPHSL